MKFRFFNNKKKKPLQDINENVIIPGDKVDCLRYEMGECILIESENGYEYESLQTGKKVSYARMIDAATGFQKVRKLN